MAFCTNCGHKLDGNQKFCPNCGSPQVVLSSESKAGGPKNPEKGTVKKLKQLNEFIDNFSKPETSAQTPFSKENLPQLPNEEHEEAGQLKWKTSAILVIVIYVLTHAGLLILFPDNDDIQGVAGFGVLVVLGILVRRKKDKPVNWLVVIFILLQLAFLAILSAVIIMEILPEDIPDYPQLIGYLGLGILLLIILFQKKKKLV